MSAYFRTIDSAPEPTTFHPSLSASDALEDRFHEIIEPPRLEYDLSNTIANCHHIIALKRQCIANAGNEAYPFYAAALRLAVQRLLSEGALTSCALDAYQQRWGIIE